MDDGLYNINILSGSLSIFVYVINFIKHTLFLCIILDSEKMAQFAMEERHCREENVRLQRKLQMEVERREALCRHLSESESSLEMEEERFVLLICCICT